eukprot:g75117.t1
MNGFDYVALGDSPVRSPKQRLHRLTPKKIAGLMFVLASLWGALKGAALVLRATHDASSHRPSSVCSQQPGSHGAGLASFWLHSFVALHDAPNELDQRAQQVPRQVLQSGHAATAAWLAEGLESDTAKIRAVFSFIAQHVTFNHQRALDIDSGRYTIQLPRGQTRSQTLSREAFETKKAVCEGISHLLNEMLASIDIRSRHVAGSSKGGEYLVGDAISDENIHVWNLVYLEGGWHLMDVTWSLWKNNSSDTTTPDGPERTDYAYWDADPRVLMFSHFPFTPADSLMEQALTRNEFISSIPAKGTLVCEGSPLVLRLLVPDDYVVSSSLYSEAEMRRAQSSFSDVVKKKERFAVSAMRAADETPASGRSSTSGSVVYVPFDVVISPRRPGIFFCVVLGGRPRSLRNVLWYKIDARKVPLQGLPAVASVEEPLSFHTLGVLSTQPSAHGAGVIVPGSLQIDTEGSATILLPGAERSRMMAKVKVDGKLVEHFAFVRTQGNRFNVQVRSPVIGNAVKAELHLYTKSIDAADVWYYPALSYEIEATAVRSVPPRFPEIQDTFFRDLCFPPGVQSSSYLNGVIRTDLSGYVLLVLGGADKSKILTELIDLGSKSEIEDFTMVEKQGALFRIPVRAPRPHSKLELRIFSKPSGDPANFFSFSIAYEVDASHVAQPRGRFAQ